MTKPSLPTHDVVRLLQNATKISSGMRTQSDGVGVFLSVESNALVVYGAHPNKSYFDKVQFSVGTHPDISQITVDVKKVLELLQSITSSSVVWDMRDKSLLIEANDTKATFPISTAPNVQMVSCESGDGVRVNAHLVRDAISQVYFSTSSDTSRPSLSSVRMCDASQNTVLFITTDGFRLSLVRVGFASGIGRDTQVPALLLRDVFCSVFRETEDVSLVFCPNDTLKMTQGETVIVTKLVSADFPPYEKVLVKSFQKSFVVQRTQIMHAIKSMAVFARDHSNIIVFDCGPESVSIRPKKEAGSNIESKVSISAVYGDLHDFSIAFNQKYIQDFLSSVEDDSITLRMNRPDSPVLFLPGAYGPDDSHENTFFQHIIMPVRLQE